MSDKRKSIVASGKKTAHELLEYQVRHYCRMTYSFRPLCETKLEHRSIYMGQLASF